MHYQITTEYNLSLSDNILASLENLLNHCLHKHNKILVLRFDLRYPDDYIANSSNSDISNFMKKLIQKYDRAKCDPYYLWVREQVSSQNQHYHCVILLNANIIQYIPSIFDNIRILWASTINSTSLSLVDTCTRNTRGIAHNNGIVLRRNAPDFMDNLNEVFRQLCYLAKDDGKSDYNDGLRDYGVSRIG